ncbi:MAG: elongation factor P [Phycisphaera sp.]|nr:elongation factor P [Phycisphaera sp.]
MKSTDLRPGMALKMDGNLYVITQFTHVTPGNLRAFVQIKIKNVVNGSYLEKRLRSNEEVERVDLDKREMQYLYKDSSGFVFMDNESYDQVTLDEDMVGDLMPFVKENTNVTGLFHDGRVITVDLPSTAELEVTETTPQPAGATATNQLKEAIVETGLMVRVPPFIKVGDTVRINTADGSYLARV